MTECDCLTRLATTPDVARLVSCPEFMDDI